jgi:hypothetical protein
MGTCEDIVFIICGTGLVILMLLVSSDDRVDITIDIVGPRNDCA